MSLVLVTPSSVHTFPRGNSNLIYLLHLFWIFLCCCVTCLSALSIGPLLVGVPKHPDTLCDKQNTLYDVWFFVISNSKSSKEVVAKLYQHLLALFPDGGVILMCSHQTFLHFLGPFWKLMKVIFYLNTQALHLSWGLLCCWVPPLSALPIGSLLVGIPQNPFPITCLHHVQMEVPYWCDHTKHLYIFLELYGSFWKSSFTWILYPSSSSWSTTPALVPDREGPATHWLKCGWIRTKESVGILILHLNSRDLNHGLIGLYSF